MNVYRENQIAYWQAGSRLWGTETPESDDDFIGIFIEPSRYLLGVEERIPPVFTETNAPVDDQGNRMKSTRDTVETKWYSAREFLLRCVKGDPNLVPLLWASAITQKGPSGYLLEEIINLLSQQVIAHHVMQVNERQKSIEKRMRHEETDIPNWKDAAHMVRVAYQAQELAESGNIVTPIIGIGFLRAVRAGNIDWPILVNTVKSIITYTACVNSALPRDEEIDLTRANAVLEDVYVNWWKNH